LRQLYQNSTSLPWCQQVFSTFFKNFFLQKVLRKSRNVLSITPPFSNVNTQIDFFAKFSTISFATKKPLKQGLFD
ncbi:MAG: hypothetical protein NC251_12175, partial [Lachnoclostridium sp.]|nr:hypothetical protein [Lachnospira sp.]MCM1249170.1 hypothetical protein [Lachnoclostridium sp.]